VIHAGIYRELVRPRLGGTGSDGMIAYEAAPGAQVIIRGSRILEGRWSQSRDPHGKGAYSKRLWMITLPDALFADGYFPFRTPNASDEEIDLMHWALQWKGRIPYTLPRGMVFQDGRRMQQLATYEDLVRLPGSYWVAPGGSQVHIHPFGSADPGPSVFEAATREHIIRPQSAGLGFIRISGLTLEHCANGFPRIGIGALYTMGGHHWIIERNTVRHTNSVGIEIGYRTFESRDKRHPPREDPDLGRTIVRHNRIYDCGTAGIRSHTVSHALVEDNVIFDCGWQDVEYYWETAGIKLLINTGTLVRNNHVYRIEAGSGIWLDWNNKNSRVSGNIIHDVRTAQAGVFIEASQAPNLVDHNVIWNIDGQGVKAGDTDQLIVAHNLIGRTTGDLVFARVITDRSLGGRRLSATGNRIVNNIFVDGRRPLALAADNFAGHNVYVTSTSRTAVKPVAGEQQSVELAADVQFDPEKLVLSWRPPEQPLPAVPAIPSCNRNFFGQEMPGESTFPGPLRASTQPESVLFRRE
jgi:alpha-L-arabinofuranosidase